MPASPNEILVIPPLVATAVLLLATHRAWRPRREWMEAIGTAIFVGVLASTVASLPPLPRATMLPFLAFAGTAIAHAYAAWRFAPDLGQRGVLWTFTATLRPTFASGLGIALTQALVHLAGGEKPLLPHTLLLIAGAIGAQLAHRRLSSLTLTKKSACHS